LTAPTSSARVKIGVLGGGRSRRAARSIRSAPSARGNQTTASSRMKPYTVPLLLTALNNCGSQR
jgi:hypothetical protein